MSEAGTGFRRVSAEDAEELYDRARSGVLAARACLMQWAAPLPDLEVTVTDEQWETVCLADTSAAEAELKLLEALEIIRTGILGWAPAEPPGEPEHGGEDDWDDTYDGRDYVRDGDA